MGPGSIGCGSGCGSVGRAVAFDSRGPQFESSHRPNIYIYCQLYLKDENKVKRGHFKKETIVLK